MSDDKKMHRLFKNYFDRCTVTAKSGKRKPVPKTFVMEYKEELRIASQLLADGVFQMMDERHFQYFMSKPKNGCMESAAASLLFQEKCSAPGAITDQLGSSSKYLIRCAIKKGDFVTYRDMEERAKVLTTKDKEKKNATEEDYQKASTKMRVDGGSMTESKESRSAALARMQSGKVAAQLAGDDGGAYGSIGTAAQRIGNLRGDLADEDSQSEEEDDDIGHDGARGAKRSGADAGVDEASTPSKSAKTKNACWFGRDEKLVDELKAHDNWMKRIRLQLQEALSDMEQKKGEAKSWGADTNCERQLVDNRVKAIKLVLAMDVIELPAPLPPSSVHPALFFCCTN